MAFTAPEIASIANASLDFYFNKGDTFKQSVQSRPLLSIMENTKKTFPGGKGNISIGVKGVSGDGSGNDIVKGYTHNDTVDFFTPANIKRANYPWREHHIGLTLTHTELKIDGISVVDTNGESTREHSRREMTVLVGLFEDKLYELGEQYCDLDEQSHVGRRRRRPQGPRGHSGDHHGEPGAWVSSAVSTPPQTLGGATGRGPRRSGPK